MITDSDVPSTSKASKHVLECLRNQVKHRIAKDDVVSLRAHSEEDSSASLVKRKVFDSHIILLSQCQDQRLRLCLLVLQALQDVPTARQYRNPNLRWHLRWPV